MTEALSQPLTPAVFALLMALIDGERHGYALMADVERITEGLIRLGPGTLYRSLQRMRVDGLIEELDDDRGAPVADRRSERRRSYRITRRGRAAARAEARRLAVLMAAAVQCGLVEVDVEEEDV
ncbi:PadR family transcriptional regulator [Sphaerisporangium flaviroseum]|uniref:PadR family transcriptional regulator n=1 Tax=Sphaerisporangium flaviroseum TaxID=509199 RepID=A0ABP7HN46_9ACTN